MSVVNCKVKYIRPKWDNLEEWMKDPNNVYIGRAGVIFINKQRFPKKASNFANPFKIGKNGTREEVIDKYREYIMLKLDNDISLQQELISMKNKNLGCWCSPDMCHGHVLLELIETYSHKN